MQANTCGIQMEGGINCKWKYVQKYEYKRKDSWNVELHCDNSSSVFQTDMNIFGFLLNALWLHDVVFEPNIKQCEVLLKSMCK